MNANPLETPLNRALILFFRVAMGWTFLYAGIHQLLDPHWSAAGFLGTTKTFHFLYAPLIGSSLMPLIDFMVKYGHLLIGLSLVSGLMIRVSGVSSEVALFIDASPCV